MSIPWNINEHHRLLHSESCFGFTAGPRWVTTSGHSTPWHEHVHRRPDTGSLWTKCFHRFLYDWHALIFSHILILACPATSWSHVFSCNFLSFRRTSRSQRNYFCWSSKTEVSRYFFKLSHFRWVTSFQVQHCFCIEFQDSPKIGYDMIGSMEDFDRLWWMTWNSHGTEPTCHFSATVELPKSFSELDLNGWKSWPKNARFEIIDSDGSGTLQVVELVQGLLKIRGEAGVLGEAAFSRVKGRALRHAIHPSFA